jgi:hypothetical protein
MNEAASEAIAPVAEQSRPPRLRARLFVKYVGLFFAVVLVALLTSGAFQVWFYYQEHKASLIRIQREQAEAASAKMGSGCCVRCRRSPSSRSLIREDASSCGFRAWPWMQ